MDSLSNQILIVIITCLFFVIVAIGVFLLILSYQKKQIKYFEEKKLLAANFNQQLLQAQLEIQEQTFNIISKEIHDNVGQILSLAKVQLNIIDQSESFDKGLITDVKDSVSKAMTDLRDIAKSLNSERILLSSLPEITEFELKRISRACFVQTKVVVEGEMQNIPEQKKLILFRIIQEALNNIIKHSKSKVINIFFYYEADFLKMQIIDNGIGFNKEVTQQLDGLGLQNIVNRAKLIGGNAHIDSIPYEGTTVTLICPYV